MNRGFRSIVMVAAVVVLVLPGLAQRNRDPLNPKEVDDLREAAQDPIQRMKLLVSYAQARMNMLEHMRSDPKLEGPNGEEVRKLLQDIATLVDEIDDNLDMYNQRTEDLRKPLKSVIEMDTDFQLKLRTMKESSSAEELRNFGLELENTTDSVNESADSARAMLTDQVAKRGKAKEVKEDPKKKKSEND